MTSTPEPWKLTMSATNAFRWTGTEWQFYEPAFGGWTTLRVGPHVSTAAMSFADGIRYLAARDLTNTSIATAEQ